MELCRQFLYNFTETLSHEHPHVQASFLFQRTNFYGTLYYCDGKPWKAQFKNDVCWFFWIWKFLTLDFKINIWNVVLFYLTWHLYSIYFGALCNYIFRWKVYYSDMVYSNFDLLIYIHCTPSHIERYVLCHKSKCKRHHCKLVFPFSLTF